MMKYKVTAPVLLQSLESLFKFSSHYKSLLWGNLFPKDIDELGEGNSYFIPSENILGDFNWLYILVSKHHNILSEYVSIRDHIEKSVISGYYDEALSLLEKAKLRFGVSIWYYETKLLIYSYSENEKKAWNF